MDLMNAPVGGVGPDATDVPEGMPLGARLASFHLSVHTFVKSYLPLPENPH